MVVFNKKTPVWEFFFWYVYIYDNMNSTKLKNQILEIFEEIETDIKNELVSESLSGAYSKLAKFLLNQVKTGKFLRNYDIDTNTGRMVFNTKSGRRRRDAAAARAPPASQDGDGATPGKSKMSYSENHGKRHEVMR